MRKAELLSPAGDFECLKAAVNNGADAVYLGGKNFSARAFAGNFGEKEFTQAIRYAHLRDVRIYVTLNTLLNEKELENALKMADFYYRNHVDGILIQDLGLFYLLKQRYPDLDLHCSTQMHIHNLEGVKNAKKLGFSRVVLARESTLDFIEEACKCNIEIETFVHGAICVAYSGQCLMSSATKNRSANKGMCAQCCRLRYQLLDEDHKKIDTDTDYLLSPKDMFLIEDLPKLIQAGVSCFKIEGRMKSPAYVGYITRMYRKAIDACYENRDFSLKEEELRNMKVLFHRGFTDDLLYGRKDLFGQKTPNHLGIRIGEVKGWKNGHCQILLEEDLHQFDGIRIGDFGCIVNMLYRNGLLTNEGKKGETVSIKTDKPLKGPVYKTQDHLLEDAILQTPEKKVPLSVKVRLMPREKASVDLTHGDVSYRYDSDILVSEAQKRPLDEESVRKQFDKLNETVYQLDGFELSTQNAFLTVSELNRLRREAVSHFDEYRLEHRERKVSVTVHPFLPVSDHGSGTRSAVQKFDTVSIDGTEYSFDPIVNPSSTYSQNEHCIVSEFGGILTDREDRIAYYSLNCCNSYTYEFLNRLGFHDVVLSSELHENEIRDLIEAFEERNHFKIRPFLLKKGKRVLMYIASDPFGKYISDRSKKYYLKDGSNEYIVRFRNGITEILEEDTDRNLSDTLCNDLIIID